VVCTELRPLFPRSQTLGGPLLGTAAPYQPRHDALSSRHEWTEQAGAVALGFCDIWKVTRGNHFRILCTEEDCDSSYYLF
jgi:hypothetical protein